MASTKDILATLYYLRRDNLWQYVKPYSLEFETDEIPRSNFKTQKVEDIPIEDVRGKEDKFSFSKKGWAVLEMESAMTYEDFQDSDKIDNIYCHELSLLILEYMKPMMASSVQIFDTAVRVEFFYIKAQTLELGFDSPRYVVVTPHFHMGRSTPQF
jgi:hypothetical protein